MAVEMSTLECAKNHLDSGATETVGSQVKMVYTLKLQLVEHHIVVVVLCVIEEQYRVRPPVWVLGAKSGYKVTYKDQEDLTVDVCLQCHPIEPTVVVDSSNHGDPGCHVLPAHSIRVPIPSPPHSMEVHFTDPSLVDVDDSLALGHLQQ